MLLGWFLVWGAWYALFVLLLMAAIIYAQAHIEGKYILEKIFGEAYTAYRKRVGMLLSRQRPGVINTIGPPWHPQVKQG